MSDRLHLVVPDVVFSMSPGSCPQPSSHTSTSGRLVLPSPSAANAISTSPPSSPPMPPSSAATCAQVLSTFTTTFSISTWTTRLAREEYTTDTASSARPLTVRTYSPPFPTSPPMKANIYSSASQTVSSQTA